ncbi:MAG: hypothetical protein M1830_008619 [Pleopsidium flavum]|nr:MAG: hypothetical protein M1830_008619 [Pleopsidium flavum]
MGGDVLAGTDFVDALQVFEQDDTTKGIILVGEIGGRAEEDAAEWIKEYRKRTFKPKPIMGLVGGVQAPRGRVMGHAGAFVAPGEADASTKIRALEDAGVVMTNHPAKFGDGMRKLLGVMSNSKTTEGVGKVQRRNMHTALRQSRPRALKLQYNPTRSQRRSLHIMQSQAFDMLGERGISTSETPLVAAEECFLAVSIDRSRFSPSIVASPTADDHNWMSSQSRRFTFDYRTGFDENMVLSIAEHLRLPPTSIVTLSHLIRNLLQIFKNKEAFLLETRLALDDEGNVQVRGARFGFDDAAFKSNRQQDVQNLRNVQDEIPEEIEAEKDGIVYIRLPGEGSIGTLVNGAGLAMNTVDALADHGGKCANFLDTGGKATSETVKSSFRIILKDSRVKTIFVNIFGGLTLCDMIANGVMLAYKDLGINVPVVVRLRGSNEELGQKMIAESGLPLFAFDDFEEAAEKVIELANAAQ